MATLHIHTNSELSAYLQDMLADASRLFRRSLGLALTAGFVLLGLSVPSAAAEPGAPSPTPSASEAVASPPASRLRAAGVGFAPWTLERGHGLSLVGRF